MFRPNRFHLDFDRPIHRLENRKVKIPKPTLEHHRRRTGEGSNQIKIGPNPHSSSCLIFISGGVAFPPLSYFISYHCCERCAHHVRIFFLMEEGLSTKDSLGRVHSAPFQHHPATIRFLIAREQKIPPLAGIGLSALLHLTS